ncbi:MAG TPA: LEPR-XLL domain-containing protein, partial [Terriglobia bacterium]|nr:LEPR-XLL domain-containing protein [Terriglobia bacterium]
MIWDWAGKFTNRSDEDGPVEVRSGFIRPRHRFSVEALEPRILLSGSIASELGSVAIVAQQQTLDLNASVLVHEADSASAFENTKSDSSSQTPDYSSSFEWTVEETAGPADESSAESSLPEIEAENLETAASAVIAASESDGEGNPASAAVTLAFEDPTDAARETLNEQSLRAPPVSDIVTNTESRGPPTDEDTVEHLLFNGAPGTSTASLELTAAFDTLFQHAKDLWNTFATGAGLTSVIGSLTAELLDLEDNALAQFQDGVISLDPTAAGRGWFVDPTPADNTEFDLNLVALPGGYAENLVDLHTVLLHEIAHALGFPDGNQLDILAPTLGLGVRILLTDLVIVDLSGEATADIQIDDDGTVDISGTLGSNGSDMHGVVLVIGNPAGTMTLQGSDLDNRWTLGD